MKWITELSHAQSIETHKHFIKNFKPKLMPTILECQEKISKLQDDLIESLKLRVSALQEIKQLKNTVKALQQIDGDVDASMTAPDGFPRRSCLWLMTPAEKIMQKALIEVEGMGADIRLTEAVVLLQKAQRQVADFVDGEPV